MHVCMYVCMQAYRNEREVGAAVKAQLEKGTVSREQLFIATKLSDSKNAGYQKVQFLYVCMYVCMYILWCVQNFYEVPIGDSCVYIYACMNVLMYVDIHF